MTVTATAGRPEWTAGPLYQKLLDIFPEHRTPTRVLDIQRLVAELGKSDEAIYKWLRGGRINPANARRIISAAELPDNVAALAKVDRQPPAFEEFVPFF